MGIHLPQYPFPKDLKQVLDNDVESITSEKSQVYRKVLNALRETKRIDITETHYAQLLKLALYLEEYQCELNMKEYDLLNKSIFKTNTNVFSFNTDEWLDEEKPAIRVRDLIDVIDITDKKSYTLRIVNINNNSIAAAEENSRFRENYSRTKIYNIRFRYQNYPMRCNHFALWLAKQRDIINYLFPIDLKPRNPTTYEIYSENMKFFNRNIKGNFEQVQAMLNIVHKSSFPYPYILYGPPGTGKTATIVESICQIVVRNPGNNVLVCTPSNTAADEVTKRLLDYKPELVFRMYSRSKDPLTINEKILPYCNCKNQEIFFVHLEHIMKKRIVITTLCSSMRLTLMGLRNDHFSHVIIDESGQSIEPDILIPVSVVGWAKRLYSQIVLAGDPKQLGPTVMSKLAEIVLGRSILERLMSYPIYKKMSDGKYNSRYITKLLVNYRNHPDIISISNRLFYNNELTTRSTAEQTKYPVIFFGTFGKEEKYQNSDSSRNLKEIDTVVMLIEHIIRYKQEWNIGRDFQEDIGVVTPFKLQQKEIKKELRKRNLSDISVGTVELFQAQEKKIIIISTVRTRIFSQGESKHIGFLSDPKRFNVAVTRAKSRLLIIGHPYALETEPTWRYLLKYCLDNKTYMGEYSSSSDDGACGSSIETSEVTVKSSDVFKWKKFKIFALDRMDSKTDTSETMHMVLNSEMNTVRSIQPITRTSSAQLTKVDPIRPISYSAKLATPIKVTPSPKAKPVLPRADPIRSISYAAKLATPIKVTPLPKAKPVLSIQSKPPIELIQSPKINPVRSTPLVKTRTSISKSPTLIDRVQPIKPLTPIELMPFPEKNNIQPTPSIKTPTTFPISPNSEVKVQKIEPAPITESTSIPKINPDRLTPLDKTTTPFLISPISEVEVQPIKPTSTPSELTPHPEINPIYSTPPVRSVHPIIQVAPNPSEINSIRPVEMKPLPSVQPTSSPEINSVRPTSTPPSAQTPAVTIQLEPKLEVQRNHSIIPKKKKKKKCCVVQ